MTQSKLLGSTLIIAGTTIGAGMLALPLASAGIGFSTSLMIMLGLWMLMAFTALLMVEIHQYADKEATLHTLAKQILGDKGKWVATFAMLFLFYSLCAAYIAGGGAQFTQRITDFTGVNVESSSGTLLFTLIVALVVTVGTGTVDRVNRVLFAGKMIAMVAVLFSLRQCFAVLPTEYADSAGLDCRGHSRHFYFLWFPRQYSCDCELLGW